MAQQFDSLSDRLIEFIHQQHLFFVATATADSRVNVSPKGMDSLRILNSNRLVWLNVTGSGNETAAHIEESPRMTIMFCAFEGKPLILRVYGQARVIHQKETEWQGLYGLFDPLPGARQIFILDIDLVQTSCGMAVPYFKFVGERELLNNWAERKGVTGIKEYWREKNQFSLDGIETDIVKKNI
ncbi:pyridoxamine 5'-phosphate oxidase family protein [Methylophaga nitratireducenticrescens]|uniref:Pyridoxamine 5'-phosphate oxidase-like protein n=1 Tax=Methylophaga nitratireducenticrescens TaxID=754476 RepID=I1XHK2_METNJ|nr:pyridoxamine 5'-phosphate oxidase family protein [Methylophaga nitratireducenticrescens]AFI83871.1 pyridoxamine 5'-phosphate oxidase [Methylophaga nitratireducenticrescens]AUZ83987.1 pyridoxamine 5'-phosphate oxidase [Methylophaga nitratireducenticrescens]